MKFLAFVVMLFALLATSASAQIFDEQAATERMAAQGFAPCAPTPDCPEYVEGLERILASPANGMIVSDIRVIDGDTFAAHIERPEAGDFRFRLWGIDAPEADQLCVLADGTGVFDAGRYASRMLERIIGDGELICQVKDIDQYNYVVVRCFGNVTDAVDAEISTALGDYIDIGEIFDIGAAMIIQGWAWDRNHRNYYALLGRFIREDALSARTAECATPWHWRSTTRVEGVRVD